ncbi:MAG: zinc ribbon domain-containing protein [Parachlamydiaceae bacterium]
MWVGGNLEGCWNIKQCGMALSYLLLHVITLPAKKCSHCDDLMNKMSLSLREWSCPKCETHHDRDINASQNLVNYYTASSPGIYACGDSSGSGTGNWSYDS